jgi:hypothetical protein
MLILPEASLLRLGTFSCRARSRILLQSSVLAQLHRSEPARARRACGPTTGRSAQGSVGRVEPARPFGRNWSFSEPTDFAVGEFE